MKLKIISTGSQGNAYILENDIEALVIECGVKLVQIKKALDFNITKIKGCIVTHEHNDHAKYINEYMKSGIDVYSTQGTFYKTGFSAKSHRQKVISNNEIFNVANFKIKAFKINHDAADPVGFLIHHPDFGVTLYLTDTAYSNYIFKGLNNLIIECNYSEDILESKLQNKEFLKNRIIGSHMSLETLMELLENNDLSHVNNIVLVHLSESNSNAKEFKDIVKLKTGCNVTVAENNQVIEFNKHPF